MRGVLPRGRKGSIIGAMTKACGGEVNRRLVLGWLFDYNGEPPLKEKSTHKLTDGQWCALNQWINYDSELYVPSAQFETEIAIITKAAISASLANDDDYNSVPDEDNLTKTAIGLGGQIKT